MGVLAIDDVRRHHRARLAAHVHMAEDPANLIGLPDGAEQQTALSQIGLAAFGQGRRSTCCRRFTAAILVLAANTAFNGFPLLASLLGRDGFLPRQLAHRGDRLVFSNGIVAPRRSSRRS